MNHTTAHHDDQTVSERAARMPPLVTAHLTIAIIWLVVGVGIGIYMSISEDFLLRPVHAHVNLLGWVTNALFGCFYWLRGGRTQPREWFGFAAFNAGAIVLLVGLTSLLNGMTGIKPFMPVGTVLVALGILQMVIAIFASSARASALRFSALTQS